MRCAWTLLALPLLSHSAIGNAFELIIGSGEGEENLVKLIHSAGDYDEGDVYFRCEARSGWIYLIHSISKRPAHNQLLISFGQIAYRPSFKVSYSEFHDGFAFDAAIPTDFEGFKQISKGGALVIDGSRYFAKSAKEQQAINTFVSICSDE